MACFWFFLGFGYGALALIVAAMLADDFGWNRMRPFDQSEFEHKWREQYKQWEPIIDQNKDA